MFAVELYEVMESQQAFNEARFTEHLRGLPTLPWQFLPIAHPSFQDERGEPCIGACAFVGTGLH